MHENPLVTVILPTYNRALLLHKSLYSVLNQTYENFEVIIVDDGSTDETAEVVQKFIKIDPRIIYLRHKKNLGASVARNSGINIAKGAYISFLDSDDEWHETKLAKQIRILKINPKIDVLSCAYELILKSTKKKIIKKSIEGRGLINEVIGGGFLIMSSCLICKKSSLLKVGGFSQSRSYQDAILLTKLAENNFYMKLTDEVLVRCYVQSESITSNLKNKITGLNTFLTVIDKTDASKKAKSFRIFKYGIYLLISGDMNAKRYFNKAFFYHKTLKHFFFFIFSFLCPHKLLVAYVNVRKIKGDKIFYKIFKQSYSKNLRK